MINRLAAAPRLSLLLMLIGVVVVGSGALRLEFDFSPEQVYGGKTAEVAVCEDHKALFRFEDSIALTLLESTDSRDLLRSDVLHWMRAFADRARQLDGVIHVSSLTTLERPVMSFGTDQNVSWVPLFSTDDYGDTEYLRSRLEQLPLLNDLLISTDRRIVLTLVSLNPDGRRIVTTRQRISAIEQLLADLTPPEGTQVSLTGVPAIRVDVIRSIIADQKLMTPLCGMLFLLVSLGMFRSVSITGISLLTVVCAVILTLGVMGWSGQTFSLLSNIIPTLVLIIGAASSVHVLSRYQDVISRTRLTSLHASRAVMVEMSGTCALTLGTTAIGFGSLLMAESSLLQSLAIQSMIGMAANYICLIFVLTPGLVLFGHRLRKIVVTESAECNENAEAGVSELWSRTADFVCRWSVPIVVVHFIVAGLALWAAGTLRINSYMLETFDSSHQVMKLAERLESQLSGLVSLEIQLQGDEPDSLFTPEMSEAMGRIRERLRPDDPITFYRDYIQILAAVDHRVLSDDADEAISALLRARRFLRRLDRPEMTSAFLTLDQQKARIMLRMQDVGSAGLNDIFPVINDVLQQELPADVKYVLTGDAYLHAVCMDQFVRDLFHSLLAATGVIFLLISCLFRSLRIGLISAIPNLLPLVITLGYMYLRGYELTAGNVIVFAISLGIAVDDTIHLLARFRDVQEKGLSTRLAIEAALQSSGRAIVLTSVLIICGISVLAFSDFVPTRRFAELTSVTMCTALPGDVILLPALLWLSRSRKVKQPTNSAGGTQVES